MAKKKKFVEDAINELTKDMNPQFEFVILKHDKGVVDIEKDIEWCDKRDKPFTITELSNMCDTKTKEMGHIRNRQHSYPGYKEQLDALWHDINNNKLDKTGEFYAALKAVKDKYPKAE